MNEVILPNATSTTFAVVGLNAALAMGNATWPTNEPIYVTTQSNPTFSFFEAELTATPKTSLNDFAQNVAEIFASLSEHQEPLGSDFESAWEKNVDTLYQS